MRIFGTVQDSIVDGPGLRFTVFVQGCPHHCPGCHNPDSHDFDGGKEMSVYEVVEQMLSNPLTQGLTLSGGEPFCQADDCLIIARAAHSHNLNVWAYTGWTFEYLLERGSAAQRELLKEIDILVDGPFILSERSFDSLWKGSRNQRIIDVKAALRGEKGVLE
jgi:anaerobic ribonucleoside-triphosphate reductase activating protein